MAAGWELLDLKMLKPCANVQKQDEQSWPPAVDSVQAMLPTFCSDKHIFKTTSHSRIL